MSIKQMVIELLFRGNSASAKAAAREVKEAVAGANAETQAATKASEADTRATKANADAKRDAARAAREQAVAEQEARQKALGAGAGSPRPAAPPAPSPSPDLPQSEKDRLRAIYNPTFAAERALKSELEGISAAKAKGALTTEEATKAELRARAALDRTTESIKRNEAAMLGRNRNLKLQPHERNILMMQFNDVFQSVAMGMPLQQVALQQGPQITQVYGGVGNTLRALRQVLTPTRIGIGLLATSVLAGGAAWNSYLRSTKEVESALDGLGRGMASSPAELEAAARAGASAAGISIKSARSMEVAFLRTGRIGSEHYSKLIGLSQDFATTMGIDANAAGGALAEMFSEPAKAAETLYRKYGLIDAATARHVQTLVAQNRESEAQGVLLDALPQKLANAEERMTALDRAMRKLKETGSGLWDNIGKSIDIIASGTTREQAMTMNLGDIGWQNSLPAFLRNDHVLNKDYARLGALRASQNYEGLNAYYAGKDRRMEQKGANALSIAEGSSATGTMRRQEELRNQIAALREGIGAPGQDAFQQREIQTTLEAKSRVLDAIINRQDRLNQLDQLDARISNERNPLLRAELEARRTRLQMADQEVSQAEIDAAAQRARNKVIDQTVLSGRTQASDMRAEAEIRARLAAQVSAGTLKAEDANRVLQEELTLRPLVAAAAKAEGEEKKRLTETIRQMREAYAAQAAAEKDAQRAADWQSYQNSKRDEIAQLRLELSLVGQTEVVRRRTLALFEAEKRIRALGITGDRAQQMKAAAIEAADFQIRLERVDGAWNDVRSSGEQAIDSIVEKLNSGDIEGALQGVADEISKTMLELAVSNPLKNALLGTNYGTLSDLGGLGGIWDRLTGKTAPADPAKLAAQAMRSVGTMQVQAGSVTISSMGAAGMIGGAAPANLAGLPGGLSGSASIQSQIWSFFAGKGLAPHQIAGIMGNAQRESGFDPFAVGDGGTSFGIFQHHGSRGQGLLSAVGGQAGLGNVQAQLEYVWKELLGPESAVLKRLMSATNVQDATSAFVGFERPQGWSMANPMGADGWATRLGGAQEALTKFSTTTLTSTANLGNLGQGFDAFGSALSQIGSGGAATGGGLFGALLGPILSGLGIPGFATGGNHMGGLRIVGENGPELEYTGPSTILPSDLTRRLLNAPAPAANVSSAPIVQFAPVLNPVNNSSIPINMHVEETTDARGQRQYNLVMSDAVAAGISAPGGKAGRTLRSQFGVRKKGISRL